MTTTRKPDLRSGDKVMAIINDNAMELEHSIAAGELTAGLRQQLRAADHLGCLGLVEYLRRHGFPAQALRDDAAGDPVHASLRAAFRNEWLDKAARPIDEQVALLVDFYGWFMGRAVTADGLRNYGCDLAAAAIDRTAKAVDPPRVLRWRFKDGYRDYWTFEAEYRGVARTDPQEEHVWLFRYASDIAYYPEINAEDVQFAGMFRAELATRFPDFNDFVQPLMGRLTTTFLGACRWVTNREET